MRTWRKTKQKIKGRYYWSLQAGARGDDDRQSLALGYVTEEEAEKALVTIQREEDRLFGTARYDRVLRLYRGERASVAGDEGASSFPNPKRAKEAARQFLLGDSTISDLFPDVEVAPDYPAMTLRAYFNRFYSPHRSGKRPKTWRTEEGDWHRHILPALGEKRVKEIDEYIVDAFLQAMTKQDGSPASYNMQRKSRNAITALLQYARRAGHHRAPIPKWFNLEGSQKRAHGEPTDLTLEEIRKLLDASGPQLRAILAAAAGLGLRPNEATRMRWEDINFEAGTVRVRGSKTDLSNATVPLLPLAEVELRRWWEEQGQPSEGPCFTPRKVGSKGYSEYQVKNGRVPWRKALATAVERSGISKRVTPYTLRHSAATMLVERGVPMASVAKLLRHSNPRMLEKHYDHTGAVRAPGLVELAPEL